MTTTVKASPEGQRRIEKARKSKHWGKNEEAWYQLARCGRNAQIKLQNGEPIDSENFQALCKEIGIDDWESIVDWGEEPPPNSDERSPQPNLPGGGSEKQKVINIDQKSVNTFAPMIGNVEGDFNMTQ